MDLITLNNIQLPIIIACQPDATQKAFVTFFTASIQNPNTRKAYIRNTLRFLNWATAQKLTLVNIEPFHVAAYREVLMKDLSAPTVKQHLTALKTLFDFMVEKQAIPFNPAAGVRPPKHSYKNGKTPKLTQKQTRTFFDSMDGTKLIDYRDRALISVMLFSFARITAAVNMRICDYRVNGHEAEFLLIDKGGQEKIIPAHHIAARFVDDYIYKAGFDSSSKDFLFRSFAKGKSKLSDNPLDRSNAWSMVKRKAKKAGLSNLISNHTFRGTGVTNFLENGGELEIAQEIAGHSDVRTTKLYDGRKHEATKSEIERIRF
jgi:integrase/recombinase XerD